MADSRIRFSLAQEIEIAAITVGRFEPSLTVLNDLFCNAGVITREITQPSGP